MQSFRIWFWLLVLCCYRLIFTRCWNSDVCSETLKLRWVLEMFTCLKKKKQSQPAESFKNSLSPPGIQLQMPASCFLCPGHAFLVSLFLWMFLAGEEPVWHEWWRERLQREVLGCGPLPSCRATCCSGWPFMGTTGAGQLLYNVDAGCAATAATATLFSCYVQWLFQKLFI